MKIFFIILLSMVNLLAVNPNALMGNWYSYSESVLDGTLTIEKEYLYLNRNHTFSVQLFVSVKKDEAFIRDLRIEGSGIWKSRDNTLVLYVNKVEVPFAKEIYQISQESLRQVANSFTRKFQNEPLRITIIESLTQKQLVTLNEQGHRTVYQRQ